MIIKGFNYIKGFNSIKTSRAEIYTTFDGINEYVSVAHNSSLDFDRTDSFSIAAKVNCTNWNSTGIIAGKYDSNSTGYIMFSNAGKLRIVLRGTTISNHLVVDTTMTFTNGIDYHVAISYNGASVSVYVDGLPVTTTVLFNTLSTSISTPTSFRIGKSESGFQFIGAIDEVAVFNTAVTSTQIGAIYDRGFKEPSYNDIPGLVSHWGMDTLNPVDKNGNMNNGTSFNMDASNIITV